MVPKETKKALPVLDPKHYAEIHEESRVSDEVISERGPYTVRTKAELERMGFSRRQQSVPGIAFPVYDVRGEKTFTLYKPDEPRMDNGKPRKYEFPTGTHMAIDVPPRCREQLGNPYVPLIFTEGVKKADALASIDRIAASVVGTWNWRGTNEQNGKVALPDLEYIAFKDRQDQGRLVYLIFDSDIMLKWEVYNALQRFRELLKKRGADIWVVYLPEGEAGQKTGIDDFFARGGTWEEVKALAQKELRRPPETDLGGRALLSKTLPDAPVSDGLVVPPGFEVGPGGILGLRVNGNTLEVATHAIASAPILLSGRTSDINSGSEFSELVYLRAGQWCRLSVSRATISNSRSIVELAEKGVPVTSGNAAALVEFLAAFEAANLELLPHAKTSAVMGWLGKGGVEGFLCGRRLIRGEELLEGVDLGELKPEDWPEGVIVFRGNDQGDEQLANSFKPRGSFEAWSDIATKVEEYPRFKIAAYTALAPPLMPIVGAENFITDFSHPTSGGKSTALRFAGSLWGNPIERSPESVVATWDSTRVWIERASGILNNLPLILDETKRAKHPANVGQTIYDVASGRSRGRGSLQGTSASSAWRLTMLSTGEQPATTFTSDGGTRARVLALWGSPFGGRGEKEAKTAAEVNDKVASHYGHAGPAFVQYLAEHRKDWKVWRRRYEELKTEYTTAAQGDSVLSRMSDYFATLRLTAELAEEAGVLPWKDVGDPIEPVYEELRREAAEADRAAIALRTVASWAEANPHTFVGRHREDQNGELIPPLQGWSGKWDQGDDWQAICFYEHRIKELIKTAGFDAESTLRTWKDRELIEVGGDKKRLTKRVRCLGALSWMVVVKREALAVEVA